MIRIEKQEHIVTTGKIKGKCSYGKPLGKMLHRQTEWLGIGQVTDALTTKRDRVEGHDRQSQRAEHPMNKFEGFMQL